MAPSQAGTSNRLTAVAEVGGTLKQVEQAFSAYQVARNQFMNSLSGFLEKKDPNNVKLEALMKNDVMAVLCCPLVQDPVPGIQSLGLQCLGKLAGADTLLSQVVVSCGVLDSVIVSLNHENAPVQAAANSVLASVSGSTAEYAHKVLTAGVMPHIIRQLQSGTPQVKEAAIGTLNSLIRSSSDHATLICDDNLLALLIALLSVPNSPHTLLLSLVLCVANIAAGSPALAEAVVRHKALTPFTAMVRGANTPPDIKAAALNALAQVCRHHEELANQVANAGVLSAGVSLLTDKMTPAIRHNAAALLLQAVQKTPDLAEVVTKGGAPSCLKQYMALEAGSSEGLIAGGMIIGSMATYKANIAKAVVDAGVGIPVIESLSHPDPEVAGVCAWAVEQMAQHGPDTAGPLIEAGALAKLVDLFRLSGRFSPAGQRKVKSAVKAVLRNAATSQSLEVFVDESLPAPLLKHLLRKLEPLLAKAPKGRQSFVTSGALQRLQMLAPPAELHPKVEEVREAINALFPDDVVKYYNA